MRAVVATSKAQMQQNDIEPRLWYDASTKTKSITQMACVKNAIINNTSWTEKINKQSAKAKTKMTNEFL